MRGAVAGGLEMRCDALRQPTELTPFSIQDMLVRISRWVVVEAEEGGLARN